MLGELLKHRAEGVRGHHHHDQVGFSDRIRDRAADRDYRRERDSRQVARVFPAPARSLRSVRHPAPENDIGLATGQEHGERGSPGARAQNRDPRPALGRHPSPQASRPALRQRCPGTRLRRAAAQGLGIDLLEVDRL